MKISDKKILKSRTLNTTSEKVWWSWTTHEGLQSFFSEHNCIELEIGGKFEIYFLMDQPYGQRGSEGCKVLSFLPNKMFSFTWNAPPRFTSIRESEYHTWVVVEIIELEDGQVKVNLWHLGWPEAEEWEPVYEYFAQAWDRLMDALEKELNE